jgi:hypothetical protein
VAIIDHATPFAEAFSGEILHPDDAGYEAARAIHNGLIDKTTGTHRPLP